MEERNQENLQELNNRFKTSIKLNFEKIRRRCNNVNGREEGEEEEEGYEIDEDEELDSKREFDESFESLDPTEMISNFKNVNVSAPMVRYSKFQFRKLISNYNTHITFTPMILAQEFSLSQKARDSDFSTSIDERGRFYMEEISSNSNSNSNSTSASTSDLKDDDDDDDSKLKNKKNFRRVRGSLIAQFGGNDPFYMGHAASLIKPYVDGIDINCGCPQSWAYKEGIGSALLRKPDLVRELIRSIKNNCGESFPVSIKIRVDDDLKNTSRLIRTAAMAGVSFITVHGRTRKQPSSHPVSLDSIKFSVEESNLISSRDGRGKVPIVANGDIFSLDDANRTRTYCGLNSVMSARGLQENPALFSGHDRIPLDGVMEFLKISAETGFIFPLYHRHLADMLNPWFYNKEEKKFFNMLSSYPSVLEFLEETFDIYL